MTTASLPRLEDADVRGERVIVRADLNVPLTHDGTVADDYRIQAFVPTVEYLMQRDAKTIVCSHLGRPAGHEPGLRLRPVAKVLSDLIGREVTPVPEVVGRGAEAACAALQSGHVLLLENLRFEPGEARNDAAFADALAALGSVYVNDAFGASHRAHASIVGLPRRLPAYAGFLLLDEVDTLGRLLEDPPRPFVVVLGGVKVADKIGVVRNLLPRADKVLIGGAMCFTFLKARGHEVGRSLVEDDQVDAVRRLLEEDHAQKIMLPLDLIVAASPQAPTGSLVSRLEMPAEAMGVDVGLSTAEAFSKEVRRAACVFWNGPMGAFENDAFSGGTRTLAMAVAQCEGYTVTGGGDTGAALSAFGLDDEVDFASTGGGAALEFLEGRTLPGIAALLESESRPDDELQTDDA